MRSKFDEQLAILNVELIKMGSLCELAISNVIKGLIEDNDEILDIVVETEIEIDEKEREIESLCMKLLLQQQPVAKDLRTISSALKMISDMERIGDQAADIAEISRYIEGDDNKNKTHIREMANATIEMVTNSIKSFVDKDLCLARDVMKADDIVDDHFDEVKKDIINLIGENKTDGESCLDLLMIAKYFERIGDHAVNIAEWVEFSITGEHESEDLRRNK
ncbi:MAG: phosphate signaling complex protein PhoU [Eubacteriales bacterium]|nr:phosphate signaling complex protein PhoU [Eubacteriales bacterium]